MWREQDRARSATIKSRAPGALKLASEGSCARWECAREAGRFLKYKFRNNGLTLINTVLAKCYGLPKIHKQDTPLRPIISWINSPTHFLVKILYYELKDSIKVPKSHLNGSLDLKKELEDLVVDDDHVLLSLDVSSLFTNVPCDLVLKSLDRRCQLIRNNCRIPFDEIISCTKFLFENTYFTFNNNIYLRIFGTPMGSPISPLFADIVIDDLDNDCLQILKDKHNLKIFNSQDNNLQFTFEVQQNNQITFWTCY